MERGQTEWPCVELRGPAEILDELEQSLASELDGLGFAGSAREWKPPDLAGEGETEKIVVYLERTFDRVGLERALAALQEGEFLRVETGLREAGHEHPHQPLERVLIVPASERQVEP